VAPLALLQVGASHGSAELTYLRAVVERAELVEVAGVLLLADGLDGLTVGGAAHAVGRVEALRAAVPDDVRCVDAFDWKKLTPAFLSSRRTAV
jgi:hypothetical protein